MIPRNLNLNSNMNSNLNSSPKPYPKTYLLLREQMERAEKRCMETGHSSQARLMERAAGAVALELKRKFPQGAKTLILCGPGNNGGDGLVLARVLQRQGWPVEVLLLNPEKNKNRHAFGGKILPWPSEKKDYEDLQKQSYLIVVDALFGTGLDRSLPVEVQALLRHFNAQSSLWRVSIDLPSGMEGDTGRVFGDPAKGAVFHAHTTVTFFLKKQGQLLLPGRLFCGEVLLHDIGIPFSLLEEELFFHDKRDRNPEREAEKKKTLGEIFSQENGPSLWQDFLLWPKPDQHKYHRGHCLIVGQEAMPGASILAAKGALRLGCGLCTLAVPPSLKIFYLQQLPCALVEEKKTPMDFMQCLRERKRNAVLIGPGAGTDSKTSMEKREELFLLLESKIPCVLDADALRLFSPEISLQEREDFFSRLHDKCVLTPHEGEFARLFPEFQSSFKCKVTRAKEASSLLGGATLLLKGGDTVVVQGSRVCLQGEAPASLATAGSGDVLAGAIVSLMAQKMPPFHAACAATWIHSRAAALFGGVGLIATDLPELFPSVLQEIQPR